MLGCVSRPFPTLLPFYSLLPPFSYLFRCQAVLTVRIRTLIDAPLGFDQHKHPGRVAPSWWTLKNAGECLNSGKRDVVYVFLHDVERYIFFLLGARLSLMNRIGLASKRSGVSILFSSVWISVEY